MANSDNVLRGGLSVKHVDTAELFSVLTFKENIPEILKPQRTADCNEGEAVYSTRAAEFTLSVITVRKGKTALIQSGGTCEIVTAAEGRLAVNGGTVLTPGESIFISADQGRYSLDGEGILYRAVVPV